MTRGKLIIITQNGVFSSSEFNGDMYPEGNGENAIEALKEVVDYNSFSKAVKAFNDRYYDYPEDEINIYKLGNTIKEAFTGDFRKNYFKIFFSDYLYIKNISGKKATIPSIREDDTLTEISLEDNEIVWMYFGSYEGSFFSK